MYAYFRPRTTGGEIFTSPDGIHWTLHTQTLFDTKSGESDNGTIHYNPFRKSQRRQNPPTRDVEKRCGLGAPKRTDSPLQVPGEKRRPLFLLGDARQERRELRLCGRWQTGIQWAGGYGQVRLRLHAPFRIRICPFTDLTKLAYAKLFFTSYPTLKSLHITQKPCQTINL